MHSTPVIFTPQSNFDQINFKNSENEFQVEPNTEEEELDQSLEEAP